MNPIKIERWDGSEEGFQRQEPGERAGATEVGDSADLRGTLDGHAHPDQRVPALRDLAASVLGAPAGCVAQGCVHRNEAVRSPVQPIVVPAHDASEDTDPMPQSTTPSPLADVPESPEAAYKCVMHPHVIVDAPGTCPICGMDLIPMENLRE